MHQKASFVREMSEIVKLSDLNPSEKEIQEWVDIDNEAPVTLTLHDDAIINSVMNQGVNTAPEEESDDEVQPASKVSWAVASQSFDNLINFSQQHSFLSHHNLMALHIIIRVTLKHPKY